MMWMSLVVANARITDFSDAKYIPVLDGDVLVFEQRDLCNFSDRRNTKTVRVLSPVPYA